MFVEFKRGEVQDDMFDIDILSNEAEGQKLFLILDLDLFTHEFNYRNPPEYIGEFLWRFSHASDTERGMDTTVMLVTKVGQYSEERLDYGWVWWRLFFKPDMDGTVKASEVKIDESEEAPTEDEPTATAKGMDYGIPSKQKVLKENLVGKPHFYTRGGVRRGRRDYVALDCATKESVFLKDAWRVAHDGIEKRGRHPQTTEQEDQETITQRYRQPELWEIVLRLSDGREGGLLPPSPRGDFERDQELLKLVWDCFKEEDGNVVRIGILNDCELSKPLHDAKAKESAKQPNRTGQNIKIGVIPHDDVESSLTVLVYLGVRWLPHSFHEVGAFLAQYFDNWVPWQGQPTCDSTKTGAMTAGKTRVGGAELEFLFPDLKMISPPNNFFENMLELHWTHYNVVERECKHLTKGPSRSNDEKADSMTGDVDSVDESASMLGNRSGRQIREDRVTASQLLTHGEGGSNSRNEEDCV
ncbi:hypothetical protein BKA93DRAFT_751909 [Sparassis latifolia]